tara:strand:- start:214 stop:513 length:300 start_codon:yes stop_codon:yes gene_type:complete
MTEYQERVEMQKRILLAEEYRGSPKWIHAHSLTSMWYETEETKEDASKGVVDTQFMDGRIERLVNSTGKKYIIKEGLTGEDLVQEVTRNLADSGKQLGE